MLYPGTNSTIFGHPRPDPGTNGPKICGYKLGGYAGVLSHAASLATLSYLSIVALKYLMPRRNKKWLLLVLAKC